MYTHPFISSRKRQFMFFFWICIAIIVHSLLLYHYIGCVPVAAFTDSVISVGIFSIIVFLLWFSVGFYRFMITDILLTVIGISFWIAGCFVGNFIGSDVSATTPPAFLPTVPFRLLGGILTWIIIWQWYRIQKLQYWKEEHQANEQIQKIQNEGMNDRIAVKDGTRIHIIAVQELIYIQACGDYVNLVTSSGQYLKEQTMKYFETFLSADQFVRIHRSTIVNVTEIDRVELFGKESYQVLLKNGTKLRISQSGYKLLKETLSI